MPIRRITSAPDTISVSDVAPRPPKIYGVIHRNYSAANPKKYLVHKERSGEWVMHSLYSPTGHLNENGHMRTLEDVQAYCAEHGHTMFEFDSQEDFARWLLNDS